MKLLGFMRMVKSPKSEDFRQCSYRDSAMQSTGSGIKNSKKDYENEL